MGKNNFEPKSSSSKSRESVTESSEYSDDSDRDSDVDSDSSMEKRMKRDLGLSHVHEQVELSVDEDGMQTLLKTLS